MKPIFLALIMTAVCVSNADEDWTTGLPVKFMGDKDDPIQYVEITNKSGKVVKRIKPGQMKDRLLHYNGGFVTKKGSGKGRILIVNSQNAVQIDVLSNYFGKVGMQMRLRIDIESGVAPQFGSSVSAKNYNANAVIFIGNDGNLPPSLVSFEQGLGLVNVSPLIGTNKKTTNERFMKAALRTFLLTCGAADYAANGDALWPVENVGALDKIQYRERFHPTVIQAVGRHMVKAGMEPTVVKTYRKACEEGWASKPSNDTEREIWEQVHAIPAKPIKIEYNEKRDKGK